MLFITLRLRSDPDKLAKVLEFEKCFEVSEEELETARDAAEEMSLEYELQNGILGSALKKEANETLFLELALRGYDLSSLRENTDATAEIVKIGRN